MGTGKTQLPHQSRQSQTQSNVSHSAIPGSIGKGFQQESETQEYESKILGAKASQTECS